MAKKTNEIQEIPMGLTAEQGRLFQRLLERWELPYVCRTADELYRATGIPISPKTQSNRDSAGFGPKGKIKIGRRVAYPAEEFFAWFVRQMVQ
jgi:hypothetical protein